MGRDRSSLRKIYLKGLGVLIASFAILLCVAVINNLQARRAVYQITQLEQKILFPLGRALEDTYGALMELKEQTVQMEPAAIASDYFNSELSNAKANLDMAMKTLSEISESVELLVPITETRQLIERFESIGAAAIAARKESLALRERLFSKFSETIRQIQEIQNDISQQLLSIKTNAPERIFLFQALNDLTAIKNSLVELQSCLEHSISTLSVNKKGESRCSEHMDDIEFLIQSARAALPERNSELKALETPLIKIDQMRKKLMDAVSSTYLKAAKAAAMADELALNLELCRQSVNTINEQINGEASSTLKNLFILLIGSILTYMALAFFSLKWVKSQIVDPLIELSRSVTGVGRGDGRFKTPNSSVKELHLLGRQLKVMSARLMMRERKIKEARRQWEAIFRAIGGPAFILDRDLRIQECNHRFLEITKNHRIEDVIGRHCYEVVCRNRPEKCECALIAMKLEQFQSPIGFERMVDGVPYFFTASPSHNAEGELDKIILIGADLSETKALELKLQRAQKMEALGTLAGGVAHDLNNILTGIVTYPDMLLMQLPEDSPLRRPLSTIKSSGERAAAVVQDLLTLARRTMDVKNVVNINDIIKEYVKSPEAERLLAINPALRIETDLAQDLKNMEGSPVHLMKMIMNLVTNSAEAIVGDGTIRISTKNIFLDRPISGYDTVEKGEYIRITIEDNGSGISPDDLPHIFEPFYSKKAMGMSGSGLGMAVVWGTVKDHKGYIDVKSWPDKGTRFDIYLPVSHRQMEEVSEDQDLTRLAGSESILVVDDIEQQRQIASDILGRLGYRVEVAKSGEEAVELCKKRCFDLVILDMIMDPGMDGLETYQRIIELCPGQKALITSGYSETDRVRKALKLGVAIYLRKPYSLKQLATAVRSCLDG
jgi:signal transduction histidine kinase